MRPRRHHVYLVIRTPKGHPNTWRHIRAYTSLKRATQEIISLNKWATGSVYAMKSIQLRPIWEEEPWSTT